MRTIAILLFAVALMLSGCHAPYGAYQDRMEIAEYWAAAAPFAIMNFTYSGTTLRLEMKNSDMDELTITDISLNGSSVYSTETLFKSDETRNITITLDKPCGASSDLYYLGDVVITYNKGSITGLREVGTRPLARWCE